MIMSVTERGYNVKQKLVEAVILSKRDYLLGIIKELVAIPSVTESASESVPGEWIKERLSTLPYFKENPQQIKWIETPLEGSPHALHSLIARVNSAKETKRTVLMVAHYDVVDIKIYGDDAPYAFNPEELAKIFFAEEEKDVLYGRGTMDMKCGVALEVDLLEEFAADRNLFDVNLVAAFVGDEENSSAGMRGVLPALAEMQTNGTDFLAALNTEPGEAGKSGEVGPMVFLGTLGKLMPSFYIRGRAAHVGNCYGGFSSALAVSRLISYAEGNPYLADPLHGKTEASWICLDMRVMKEGYSVTLPDRAYAYFNCFTTVNTPAIVMEQMKSIVSYSISQTSAQLVESHRNMVAAGYNGCDFVPSRPKVFTLNELTDLARKSYGPSFEEELESFAKNLPSGDMRERGIKIVDKIADMSGEDGPYAVCFFLPPWLPVRTDFTENARDKEVIASIREIEEFACGKYGVKIAEEEFFAGLCDLSYVGGKVSDEDLESYSSNVPGWRDIYSIPLTEMNGLGLPVVNIGPSGEYPHKKMEKLHLNYSLDILPELLRETIKTISKKVS